VNISVFAVLVNNQCRKSWQEYGAFIFSALHNFEIARAICFSRVFAFIPAKGARRGSAAALIAFMTTTGNSPAMSFPLLCPENLLPVIDKDGNAPALNPLYAITDAAAAS